MKHLLLLITIILASCAVTQPTVPEIIVRDTLYFEVQDVSQVEQLQAEVKFWRDSVYYLNQTTPVDVYMNARKIEKIKYYISITDSRPANKKFFYGWIKRTIAE